ncbi:DUF6515 family protein [Pantoea sp. NPDC088449]|uniref:DUF6515 family protein n=1 Tax=Pantoea sp. NPDC088449 TaxID=3364392 RepID=UPI000ED6835F|nr:hypothetical protein [Pantoea sp.]
MKNVIASVLALTLLTPAISHAYPGGWGPGPHWGRGPHWGGPGPLRFLPEAATAVLIGGLTYYMLNGSYYQRQGDTYVVVQPPDSPPAGGMRVLDFNGKRYYVQEGHYYQREIGGSYIEVPRPYGL